MTNETKTPVLLTEAEARAIYIAATSPDDFNNRLRERGLIAPVTVTTADRAAAAAYYYSAGGCQNIVNLIRSGERDGWFRVQAFARYRQRAEAASSEAEGV